MMVFFKGPVKEIPALQIQFTVPRQIRSVKPVRKSFGYSATRGSSVGSSLMELKK